MFSGCSHDADTDQIQGFPDIGIAVKDLNRHLKIDTPAIVPSFQKDDRIILVVENLSSSPILVEPAKSVKLFRKSISGWEPVQNNFNYNEVSWLLPGKGGHMLGDVQFGIFPDLYNLKESITLRVVVIGKFDHRPGVENTVSYVDITVKP
jgi:hypothetical protein